MRKLLISIAAAIGLLVLFGGVAAAHEGREVGEFQFVVGFINEPAFEGVVNAATARITQPGENGESVGVEGLAETLSVEVTHAGTGTSEEMELRGVFGQPGFYAADFLPTEPGVYRFRFFGTVAGVEVDETFVSRGEGGGFDDIKPIADFQFPNPVPAARELENAARGAQTAATAAQDIAIEARDSASSANTMGILGIVVGAIGVVAGGAGIALAMRKP